MVVWGKESDLDIRWLSMEDRTTHREHRIAYAIPNPSIRGPRLMGG